MISVDGSSVGSSVHKWDRRHPRLVSPSLTTASNGIQAASKPCKNEDALQTILFVSPSGKSAKGLQSGVRNRSLYGVRSMYRCLAHSEERPMNRKSRGCGVKSWIKLICSKPDTLPQNREIRISHQWTSPSRNRAAAMKDKGQRLSGYINAHTLLHSRLEVSVKDCEACIDLTLSLQNPASRLN